MSRTTIYKGVYFAMVGIPSAAILWAIAFRHLSPLALLALLPLLLIPGRILGFFWKDLLRGLHQLHEKNYTESKRYSERFLAELRRKPWLRHLIWLGSSSYSRNPESLALNNLGGAEIGLGDFDSARAHLEASITADSRNPLPYFNMGILFMKQGNPEEAERWLCRSIELGFSGSAVDKIVMASQRRFAATDGGSHS